MNQFLCMCIICIVNIFYILCRVAPGRIRETFFPTPVISSYLVAFHVSDFVETDTYSTPWEPLRIISRPGPTNQHGYATTMGVMITYELSNYFGIYYYTMGQGSPMKNDHIALPDFPSGAMENWGMVNYRFDIIIILHNLQIVCDIFKTF